MVISMFNPPPLVSFNACPVKQFDETILFAKRSKSQISIVIQSSNNIAVECSQKSHLINSFFQVPLLKETLEYPVKEVV